MMFRRLNQFMAAVNYFILFVCVKESSSLKSMRLRVPEVVKSGETVTLSCEYDLEQVALYTIKWYWKDVEFYRFVPKESPPFRAFTMKYINVDISRSGPTQVTLRAVHKELTGDYKCEVSADGPLFHTGIQVAHMTVAELPSSGDDNPSMRIDQDVEKVEFGKRIKAECISPGSDPPANLTWFINDEPMGAEEENESVTVLETEIETDSALGLHSSHSRIEIITNRAHFLLGIMTIKCEASIYGLWTRTVEDFVRDDAPPQLAPVLGSTSSQSQAEDNSHNIEISAESSGAASEGALSRSRRVLLLLVVFVFLQR